MADAIATGIRREAILRTIETFVQELPDADISYWMGKPDIVLSSLGEVFCISNLEAEIISVQPNSLPIDELLERGDYQVISDGARLFIHSAHFHFEPLLSTRLFAIIHFEHEVSTHEVESYFRKKGLALPQTEDVLLMGADLHAHSLRGEIAFLHRDHLIHEPGQAPQILLIHSEAGKRILRCMRYRHVWKSGHLFVARIPNEHPLASHHFNPR